MLKEMKYIIFCVIEINKNWGIDCLNVAENKKVSFCLDIVFITSILSGSLG